MPQQHRGISLSRLHFTSTPQQCLIYPEILHSNFRSGIYSCSTGHYRNSDLLLQGESFNLYTMICYKQQFYIKLPKISLSGIIVNFYLPPLDSKGRFKNFPSAL